MKEAGNPWMKFYPSDWRADPALRACSIAARGLWIEMLCIMHEAEPYGSLLIKSKRIDKKQLASLCGIQERECVVLLLELEGFGVFERDSDGTVYSRRMRRDAAKSEEGRRQVARRADRSPTRSPTRSDPGEQGRSPSTQKPEARVDRIGSARASPSGFTEGSKALASAFWKALGFDDPKAIPPEFAGIDWRAVGWEAAGWTVDLIDSEARRIGPDKPLTYHEKVFATAFAKRQAPLPVAVVKEGETIHVQADRRTQSESLGAVANRLADAGIGFGPRPSGLRNPESRTALEPVSEG